ncbi:hypothetical protein [Micromonospora lupini]|uniref:restriction endonuclease subunit S n=1 Tax=Micromonospora lupini TaxID=285679 RepID=UPI0033CBCFFA
MTVPFAIPDNWSWGTIGDVVCRVEAGKSFTCLPRRARDDEWGIIKVSAMTWREFREHENKAVPPDREIDPRFEIHPGDILVSRANTEQYVGAPVLVGACRPRLLLSDKSLRLVPASGIDKAWLLNVLASPFVRRQISTRASGQQDSMRNISQQTLLAIDLPIPPVAEQRRIVDALEEYLVRVQSSQQGVRRAMMRLEILRGSLRQAVVCGGKLPVQHMSDGWRWGKLRDVVDGVEAGKSFACHPRPARADEWGVIKVSAMTWGEFRPQENKAVPVDYPVNPAHRLEAGDLLVSRANTEAYVGAPVIVRNLQADLLLSDKSLRLRIRAGIDKEWLLQVLSSPFVRRQISDKATGTKDSMRNISQQALLDVDIAIPQPMQQSILASQLSGRLEGLERLAAELAAVLKQGDLLRSALLHAAFDGRLVSQDPNDEPASELLERIHVERAAAPPKQKARRRTHQELTAPRTTVTGDNYQQEALPL